MAFSFTRSALPAPGSPGRVALVSDDVRGLWADTGVNWYSLAGEAANVREFGAIGDGHPHPLSERFATIAAAQAVYPHAAALTDEIDWCALQGAIDLFSNQGRSGQVLVPPGAYVINRPLEYRGRTGWSFNLTGGGMGTFGGTIIRWNGRWDATTPHRTMFRLLGSYNTIIANLTLNAAPLTPAAEAPLVTLLIDYDYDRRQGAHNVTLSDVRVYAAGVPGTKAIQIGTLNFQASEIFFRHVFVETTASSVGTDDVGIWTSNANVKNFAFHGVWVNGFKTGIHYIGSGALLVSGALFSHNTVADVTHAGTGTLVIDGAQSEVSGAAYLGPGTTSFAAASIRGWQFHGSHVLAEDDAVAVKPYAYVVSGGCAALSVSESYFVMERYRRRKCVDAVGVVQDVIDLEARLEPRFSIATGGPGITGSLTVRNVSFQNGPEGHAPIWLFESEEFPTPRVTHDTPGNVTDSYRSKYTFIEVSNCTATRFAPAVPDTRVPLTYPYSGPPRPCWPAHPPHPQDKLLHYFYPNYRAGGQTIVPIARVAELGGVTTDPAPVATAGPGAGTGTGTGAPPADILAEGNYLSGTISLKTGASPAAAEEVARVRFGVHALNSAPRILITPADAGAAALSGTAQVYVDAAQTTPQQFVLKVGDTALAAGAAYRWHYFVVQ